MPTIVVKINLTDVDSEKLKGNVSDNKLFGGDGKDTITGAAGNDTLKGGADADCFLFSSALDATTNVDHIVDFKPGTDKSALDNAIFTKLGSGSTLKAAAFYDAATSHDSSDRILTRSRQESCSTMPMVTSLAAQTRSCSPYWTSIQRSAGAIF